MSTPNSPQNVRVDPKGSATDPAQPLPGTPGTTGAPGTPASPPKHEGPGRVKRTARTVKQVLLVVLGALIAAFALSNLEDVKVRWIFGDAVDVPLIAVIGISLVAGLVIGWLGAKLTGRNSD